MEEDKRLESIVSVLLEYTLLQFDQQIELSNRGDEIDAIAAGINTIGEELKYTLEEERRAKKQLEEYSKKLEARNRELEEFIYITSHDLQEPIQSVKSFSSILKEELDMDADEERSYMFKQIELSTNRMGRQIHGLLEYLKIGSKNVVEKINVQEVVDETLAMNKELINLKGAKISVDNLPEIIGHKTEIKILLNHLIANAILYVSPDVKPAVEISGNETSDGWVLHVKDNGIGIRSEHQERIFRIFQRLQQRSESSGIGIGLALCQKVAEIHNGNISVVSKVGVGSTFTVSFSKNLPNQYSGLSQLAS